MSAHWIKSFPFSASHQSGGQIFGRNYVFSITLSCDRSFDEDRAVQAIEKKLIARLHSRDLSLHTQFLKLPKVTEMEMLRSFLKILKKELRPMKIRRIALRRDDRTEIEMLNAP